MFIRVLPAALLLAGYSSAYATEADVESPPIIVTATRTAQTVDETLASVTVITRADIEQQQAQSVQDLLRGVAGLSVTNNGGAGKATSVFMRGTESGHVLVLVDGIKVGSATLGTTAFQDIPVDQIDRIEIVRGPRSSLYGSEAIGGVIQIFTRRGDGGLTPYASLTAGSYKTYGASAGISGGGGRGWFSLNASDSMTEGFNACVGSYSGGCYTYEPDKDGYRSASGSLRAGYRFNDRTEVEMNWLRAETDNQYDGGSTNSSQTVQEASGAQLRFSPHSAWQSRLTVGRSRDESNDYKDGNFVSRFDTLRDVVLFQNDVTLGAQQILTLGADHQNDEITGTTAYSVKSRDNRALFVQHQAGFDDNDVQASWRRDNNGQFGYYDTGSLAWGYRISSGLRATASYGTAFKAPTFNQLYWPYGSSTYSGVTYISYGNPNLKPVESRTAEIGLRSKSIGGSVASLSVYVTQLQNLINWTTTSTGVSEYTSTPENLDRARIRGLELQLANRLAGWDTQTNVTFMDPENLASGTNYGTVLPRRAEQALRVDADRGFGIYKFGATLRAEGRRYDDLANTVELPAYATLDLRAEQALGKDWRLQARIENLTDKHYETAAYYNQPGRSGYLTLRYQPARR